MVTTNSSQDLSSRPLVFHNTTNVIPFPQLAEAIRSAPISEVIQAFQELAGFAMQAHRVKMLGPLLCPEDTQEWVKSRRRLVRWQGPHVISKLMEAENDIFDFIHRHIDKVDIPDFQVDPFRDITAAQEWLVRCAIHPDVDTDGHLRRIWEPYVQEQPWYNPTEHPYMYYTRQYWKIFQAESSSPTFPGLENALRNVTSGRPYNSVGVFGVLKAYMRLASTAAYVWSHIWQTGGGIQRGQSLPHNHSHLRNAIPHINERQSDLVNDWQSEMPLYVRSELAKSNFSGDFLFLMNHVFPKFIAPRNSTIRETMFAYEFQCWIITTALRPEVDPRGYIAQLIRTSKLDPGPSGSLNHDWQSLITPYIRYQLSDNHMKDVDLVPWGPRNDALSYSEQELNPSQGSVCTICIEKFGTDPHESSCRQLHVCEHLFHWECLDALINASWVEVVSCPNCRARICDARPRKAKRD